MRPPSDPGKELKAPSHTLQLLGRLRASTEPAGRAEQELAEVCQARSKSLESCSSLSERLAWPSGATG